MPLLVAEQDLAGLQRLERGHQGLEGGLVVHAVGDEDEVDRVVVFVALEVAGVSPAEDGAVDGGWLGEDGLVGGRVLLQQGECLGQVG